MGYLWKSRQEPWLVTDIGLSVFGGSRNRFKEAQESQLGQVSKVLEDLKYGLYLGTEEYAKGCIERLKGKRHPEKPQIRRMLQGQNIEEILGKILNGLGKVDFNSICAVRKAKNPDRDLAIYALWRIGVFSNQEIGRVFGVGYTTVTEAVKRAETYMSQHPEAQERIERVLIDI